MKTVEPMKILNRILYIVLFTLAVAACSDEMGPDSALLADEADPSSCEPGDEEITQDQIGAPFETLASGLPALKQQCDEVVGAAGVEEVAPGLFVARGFDLANTVLVQTPEGNVVIDVSISPERAEVVKEALHAVAPGPTLAIIYTHSHADHIGGASVWAEEGTQIWATEAFFPNLIDAYGELSAAELHRTRLQFGNDIAPEHIPCSAIGARPELEEAMVTGVRKPTHTFSGHISVEIGGVTFELVEAHGETRDHLFVWIPEMEALLPGDNYYAAFPNLYTIRGTSPRPVAQWIQSLDAMRAFDAEFLVPSHTGPISGRQHVRTALRNYRDAIQSIRNQVIQGANQLQTVDQLVSQIRLPEHLRQDPALDELYGQVDWSVRAIYSNELGWFDGRQERLYPPANATQREIQMMGGADAVLQAARTSLEQGDSRWASHLLGKLRDSGEYEAGTLDEDLAAAYGAMGETVSNANGRSYVLQAAHQLIHGAGEAKRPQLEEIFIDELPIETFFEVMATRIKPGEGDNVEEALQVVFTDIDEQFTITIRHGVTEIIRGEPLPDTPEIVSIIETDTPTWRRISLQLMDPLDAFQEGTLSASDVFQALTFTGRFETGN